MSKQRLRRCECSWHFTPVKLPLYFTTPRLATLLRSRVVVALAVRPMVNLALALALALSLATPILDIYTQRSATGGSAEFPWENF